MRNFSVIKYLIISLFNHSEKFERKFLVNEVKNIILLRNIYSFLNLQSFVNFIHSWSLFTKIFNFGYNRVFQIMHALLRNLHISRVYGSCIETRQIFRLCCKIRTVVNSKRILRMFICFWERKVIHDLPICSSIPDQPFSYSVD